MDLEANQQALETHYQKQLDGRKVFWKDKYKPYMSLYRDRRLHRDREIANALPNPVGSVLDIGCGQGDLLALLSPRAQTVVGTDLVDVMVETARVNLRDYPNVRVLASPAESLPFPDQSIDAAILADVIEHLLDPVGCLREIRRVLKPAGLVVITTPNAAMEMKWKRLDQVLNAPFRWFRRRKPVTRQAPFERLYRREELVAIAHQADYRIRTHRFIEFYPGSEGGGSFARVLRLIARERHLREWIVEPVFRKLFAAIERRERFNNRQLLVLQKP
ncbi:MAG TPA: class I SAM-dependent methyltransferase [Candidatus Nitrosotalea sp.]|nr:class I SAM-dependent methyltransferase [Candidatus Nitrosotalea sp.]